jgi:hypothetical protein
MPTYIISAETTLAVRENVDIDLKPLCEGRLRQVVV